MSSYRSSLRSVAAELERLGFSADTDLRADKIVYALAEMAAHVGPARFNGARMALKGYLTWRNDPNARKPLDVAAVFREVRKRATVDDPQDFDPKEVWSRIKASNTRQLVNGFPLALRDAAFIALLFGTGMRPGEAALLRESSINFATKTVSAPPLQAHGRRGHRIARPGASTRPEVEGPQRAQGRRAVSPDAIPVPRARGRARVSERVAGHPHALRMVASHRRGSSRPVRSRDPTKGVEACPQVSSSYRIGALSPFLGTTGHSSVGLLRRMDLSPAPRLSTESCTPFSSSIFSSSISTESCTPCSSSISNDPMTRRRASIRDSIRTSS